MTWTAKHFKPAEFLVTSRAEFAQRQKAGATLPNVAKAIEVLAETLMDPIRFHVGKPIRINSGYRCPELNKAINGSPTSQHKEGEAADFVIVGGTEQELWELWRWIAFDAGLEFGQCIFEDARPGVEGGAWIHISLGKPYRQNCQDVQVWTPAGYRKITTRPDKRG
jgi:zinc D-Ala-D-Ala carboxypeptidase